MDKKYNNSRDFQYPIFDNGQIIHQEINKKSLNLKYKLDHMYLTGYYIQQQQNIYSCQAHMKNFPGQVISKVTNKPS